MGQRLNIEIVNSDGVLANAYYHWSAYTGSAIELTLMAVGKYWEVENIDKDLQKAVKMLEATGAGITDGELISIKADRRLSSGITYSSICNNRNLGLIAVTENGIEETRRWEEGRVTIDIESKTVEFMVLWECTEEEYNENMEDDYAYSRLNRMEFDFSSIPFENIHRLEAIYQDNPNGIICSDGYVVDWMG